MRAGLSDLYAELERSPEDWSVRIRLIEIAVSSGDLSEAKQLVRNSPDGDRHLPRELQDRIHALLTHRDTENPINVSIAVEERFPGSYSDSGK